jgi:hypothetical protein
MKVRMADLWKPVKGVTIKETPTGKFLFHFNHPLDMEAVLNGGPWSFDNNTLILERVDIRMQVEHIPLYFVNMWVQVHDLPMGLMKERVGIRLANFIGSFLEYDKNNNSTFWRQYMRIRMKIDVRMPLKKDTKVMNKEGGWCVVKFKYEKLGMFCFVCGLMGHAENKCEVRFSMEQDDGVREWSAEIRAEPRRQGGRMVSRWLREEKGSRSVEGSSVAEGTSPAVETAGAASTGADMGPRHQPNSNNSQNSNHSAIIFPINVQAHTINSVTKNHIISRSLTTTNPIANHDAIMTHHEFVPPLMTTQNLTINPLFHFTTTKNGNPSNLQPLLPNQFSPPTNIQSETETFENHSLNNQIIAFNSKPILNKQKNPRTTTKNGNPRVMRSMLTRPGQQSNSDPFLNQPRPEKKSKNTEPEPSLIQNPTRNPTILTVPNELDNQGEKKRRREEEGRNNLETLQQDEHFLTAGPGSQACRDQ